MQFLINELSFIGQAQNKYEADQFMAILYKIIIELEPLRNNNSIKNHRNFSTANLCNNYTVYEWFYEKTKSASSDERKMAKLFLIMATKGPFIDEVLNQLNCSCYFNNNDVSSSCLAVASYLQGCLISLQGAPEFEEQSLNVQFAENRNQAAQDITVINLTTVIQAQSLGRLYVPSPKHSLGGWGTLMDLTDEIAQIVLNQGIAHGRQIYGYYQGKYYEFQSDNAGGFHGYPIEDSEVPPRVIKYFSSQN